MMIQLTGALVLISDCITEEVIQSPTLIQELNQEVPDSILDRDLKHFLVQLKIPFSSGKKNNPLKNNRQLKLILNFMYNEYVPEVISSLEINSYNFHRTHPVKK